MRGVAAREDPQAQAGEVPEQEPDHADPDGQRGPAGIGPEGQPEAAVEDRQAAQRDEQGTEVQERSSADGAPHAAGPRGREEPGRSGAGSGRADVSPSIRFTTSSALIRHIGSPTPGIVPPPACSRLGTRADASPGRNIALCRSVCSMPSAVPRQAWKSRAKSAGPRTRARPPGRAGPGCPPRTRSGRGSGPRGRRGRDRRVGGERDEDEQVLVARRCGGRVGGRGPRDVQGGHLGDPRRRRRAVGAEDVLEVRRPVAREEQRVVGQLGQLAADAGHDQQRRDAGPRSSHAVSGRSLYARVEQRGLGVVPVRCRDDDVRGHHLAVTSRTPRAA